MFVMWLVILGISSCWFDHSAGMWLLLIVFVAQDSWDINNKR